MEKNNKYLDGWKLYVNYGQGWEYYGQGWEYETFEETYKSYRENRKAYQENCTYPQRWTKEGREPNPRFFAVNKKKTEKKTMDITIGLKFEYGGKLHEVIEMIDTKQNPYLKENIVVTKDKMDRKMSWSEKKLSHFLKTKAAVIVN